MKALRSLVLLVALGLTSLAAPPPAAQQAPETIIRGGEVFTAGGLRQADIRVVGSTIAEIGTGLAARGAGTREIDARGRLVLSGGVDPTCTSAATGWTTTRRARPRPSRAA